MKNLLITNQNIFHIYGLVTKILRNKKISSQHFYSNHKKLQSNCNRIGFDNGFIITKSNNNIFNVVESRCSILSEKYYINLNNAVISNDPYDVDYDWTLPTYKATVIYVGEKITIKNNTIYLTKIEESPLYGFKTLRKIIHKISIVS